MRPLREGQVGRIWSQQIYSLQGVVEGVATRFASQAGQLLENLRQTESALKRLKKNRPEAGEAGQLSDIEKISLQLFLDVQVCPQPTQLHCTKALPSLSNLEAMV